MKFRKRKATKIFLPTDWDNHFNMRLCPFVLSADVDGPGIQWIRIFNKKLYPCHQFGHPAATCNSWLSILKGGKFKLVRGVVDLSATCCCQRARDVTHIPARRRWKETKVERDDLFVSRRAERKGEVFWGDSSPLYQGVPLVQCCIPSHFAP